MYESSSSPRACVEGYGDGPFYKRELFHRSLPLSIQSPAEFSCPQIPPSSPLPLRFSLHLPLNLLEKCIENQTEKLTTNPTIALIGT